MKRKIRRGLMVLLALIFVGSLGMVIYRTMEYKEGEEIYAEAAELVQLPDLSDLPDPVLEETEETEETDAPVYVDPYADALRNMDFAALREVNSDVLGWILIPNTVISLSLIHIYADGDGCPRFLHPAHRQLERCGGKVPGYRAGKQNQ